MQLVSEREAMIKIKFIKFKRKNPLPTQVLHHRLGAGVDVELPIARVHVAADGVYADEVPGLFAGGEDFLPQ